MKLCSAALLLALPITVMAGQTNVQAPAGEAPAKSAAAPPEVFSVPPVRPPRPTDVLAEVDGTKLLRREAEAEVNVKLSAAKGNLKPERIVALRNRIRREVLQQFVMKTLLLHEAERRGIKVTSEDEQMAMERLREKLPPGVTPEDAMRNSPVGEERMRKELIAGLTIEKLIANSLTNELEVTDAQVDAFFAENKDRLATPEKVHARHILIKVDETDSDAVKAEKLKKAIDLRRQLFQGADFAELAREDSDCPSKVRGGDLGFFTRGRMVPEFEKAAFSQDVDEIGRVLKTKFGYHIIQVLEHDMPSELTRERARQMLVQKNKQTVLRQLLRTLKDKAHIKPAHILETSAPMLPHMPAPGESSPAPHAPGGE